MSALAVVSAVLAVAWLVPAGVAARSADAGVRARLAPQFLGLAAVHAAAAAWAPLAPLVPAAWFAQAVALPDGRGTSRWRRAAAAGAGMGATGWSGWLAVRGSAPGIAAYLTAAALLTAIAVLAVAARCRRGGAPRPRRRGPRPAGGPRRPAHPAVAGGRRGLRGRVRRDRADPARDGGIA